jgi:streptomycin 6-kinase
VTAAVHERLGWWRTEPGGAAWLERLPRLVEECAAAWGLHVRAPFPATVSYVAPAALRDGTQAVLKINFPEPESEHEADALAEWGGRGAVRLLARDAGRRALLVERCLPGTQLWGVADEEQANRSAAGVLRALWRPPTEGPGFRTLAGEARRWAAELPVRWQRHGGPVDRAVIDGAVGWIDELLASADREGDTLLHQDLHGGNVLRAERAAFLAIDPKPLVGERAFDLASLVRDRRPALASEPHPVARLRRRLDQLAAELDLDRERMRRWAVIHALAWGMEDGRAFPDILACAVWLERA